MARLLLMLDGQVLAEYNMTKERYTLGRLPDNDIRVDNPGVSGHHALIVNILNDSFLEDLNSTNGTYVNGKLIKKHALQNGDVLTLGRHSLRFIDSQGEVNDSDEFEKTMVIAPGQITEEKLRAAASALSPSPRPDTADTSSSTRPSAEYRPPGEASSGRLQVLSGQFAGREIELLKPLTTLGRPGVQVAAISRRAEGYSIVHVESATAGDYPLVNGEPIGPQARRLLNNDVITLAGIKMGFFIS